MRPNILYIHSHDTGRQVQPYGHPVRTPHLQRLAEQGVLFRQAFAAAPVCSPSRAALLTGQSAHATGMLGLAHRGWRLHDYDRHLLHALRAAGYQSALAGVQHIAVGPDAAARIGYDKSLPVENERAEHVAPAAVRFLESGPQEPFFLDVGFVETHLLPGPGAYGYGTGDARYARAPAGLPDTPRTRQDAADYLLAASALDGGVGMVLEALERSGLAERTLVVCTTDHGLPLPGMKCSLSDRGLGVMLIVRGPGGFEGGRVLDALVSQLDLFPTVCDLLGLERPAWLEGESLMPLVRDEKAEVREEVFAGVTHHAAYDPQRAVRTRRWKYVRRLGDRARPVLPNVDDSASKQEWVEAGWRERALPSEELYDLVLDPEEGRNLAGEHEQAATLSELRARLERWMRDTGDPLLRGPVPVPPGTVEKDPDGLSPKESGKVRD